MCLFGGVFGKSMEFVNEIACYQVCGIKFLGLARFTHFSSKVSIF